MQSTKMSGATRTTYEFLVSHFGVINSFTPTEAINAIADHFKVNAHRAADRYKDVRKAGGIYT